MGTTIKIVDDDGDKNYVPFKADSLPVGSILPFDVSVKGKDGMKPLYGKGTVFSNLAREYLNGKGISELYVDKDKASILGQFLLRAERRSSLYDEKTLKDYSYQKEQHYQIERAALISGMGVNFSLFLLNKEEIRTLLLTTEESPVAIEAGILSSEGDIVILKKDIPLYREFLSGLATSKDLPEKDKSKIEIVALKENTKMIIKDIFDNPMSRDKLRASQGLIVKIIECLSKNKELIYDLLSLKSHDHYTYTHSLNVGVLSIGVGLAVGLKNDDIEKLGIGALFHDIGKTAIPSEILNKMGRLDMTEFEVYKKHVTEGEKILHDNRDIPVEALDAILQHHEKLTGKGYPMQLHDSEIKLSGRITAIADCYDSLTTPRLFKASNTPYSALSIISKEKNDYDPELLKEFIKMLAKIK